MPTSALLRKSVLACSISLVLLGTSSTATAASTSLFTPVQTVTVTPSGNYTNADFARIGYVPTKDRIIVTFGTLLSQPQGGCSTVKCQDAWCAIPAYAYKEYKPDTMEETANGVMSCHSMTDTGGLFIGDDFYLAAAENHSALDGWYLAKFSTGTWGAPSIEKWYSWTDTQMSPYDPSLMYVNGRIDISSSYTPGSTHHHSFGTDLDLATVVTRTISNPTHFHFTSTIMQGGVIYFLSSTGATGPLIAMHFDTSWNYSGVTNTLADTGATPMAVAFDGNRFYVTYTQRTNITDPENVRLAAFDTSWNVVDDIALTTHTTDQMSAIHPYLVLKGSRLYVSYSQNAPAGGIETLQAYVKVFDISTAPVCTSFTISPSSTSTSASAGSQQVTLTGVPSGCVGGAWTTSSSDSWLTVSPTKSTEPGTATVSWTENTVASPRTGTVTIAGNTFSVTQAGALPVLTATRTYDSTLGAIVNVSWTNPSGAGSFVLERATNLGGFAQRAVVTGTSMYSDVIGLGAAVSTLLYRVHELGSSQYSNIDYTTLLFFTDDPLVGGSTEVKAVHLTEIRQAVDAMRAAANLTAVTWTDSPPNGATVQAVHITELRSALTAAINAFAITTPSFTDSSLASGQTIKAAHFQELRTAVK